MSVFVLSRIDYCNCSYIFLAACLTSSRELRVLLLALYSVSERLTMSHHLYIILAVFHFKLTSNSSSPYFAVFLFVVFARYSCQSLCSTPASKVSWLGPRRISFYSTYQTGDIWLFLLLQSQYLESSASVSSHSRVGTCPLI